MVRKRDDPTPRIDRVDPRDLDEADVGVLVGDTRLDGLRVSGDASGARLASLALDECVLEGVTLDDAVLHGARFGDTVLDGVTGTAVRGTRMVLRDVRIDGCRFGAAEWFEAEWDRVLVTGCRIDYLGLADGRLSDVRFVDCTVDELDLRGGTVTRVALDGCRLRSLSIADATLSGFDLRGTEFDRIDSPRHLRGAIVSESQLPRLAPLLAEALDITVR